MIAIRILYLQVAVFQKKFQFAHARLHSKVQNCILCRFLLCTIWVSINTADWRKTIILHNNTHSYYNFHSVQLLDAPSFNRKRQLWLFSFNSIPLTTPPWSYAIAMSYSFPPTTPSATPWSYFVKQAAADKDVWSSCIIKCSQPSACQIESWMTRICKHADLVCYCTFKRQSMSIYHAFQNLIAGRNGLIETIQ